MALRMLEDDEIPRYSIQYGSYLNDARIHLSGLHAQLEVSLPVQPSEVSSRATSHCRSKSPKLPNGWAPRLWVDSMTT